MRELDGVGWGQHKCGAVLLEDDQSHPVAALVGIRQQGQDRALGGVHPFCHCHGPGGIHQEQDQVGHALDPDLALQVGRLDGESQPFSFLCAVHLVGSRGAEGGVEGDVILLVSGRTRLDIASVLALGLG